MNYVPVYIVSKEGVEYTALLHNLTISSFRKNGAAKYKVYFPGISYGIEIAKETYDSLAIKMESVYD